MGARVLDDEKIEQQIGQKPEKERPCCLSAARASPAHHQPTDHEEQQAAEEIDRVVERAHLYEEGQVEGLAQPTDAVGQIVLGRGKVGMEVGGQVGSGNQERAEQTHGHQCENQRPRLSALAPAEPEQPGQRQGNQSKLVMQHQAKGAQQRCQDNPAHLTSSREYPPGKNSGHHQQNDDSLILDDARQPDDKAVQGEEHAGPERGLVAEETASQQCYAQHSNHASDPEQHARRRFIGCAQRAVEHRCQGQLAGPFGVAGKSVIFAADGVAGAGQDDGLVVVKLVIAQAGQTQKDGQHDQRQ